MEKVKKAQNPNFFTMPGASGQQVLVDIVGTVGGCGASIGILALYGTAAGGPVGTGIGTIVGAAGCMLGFISGEIVNTAASGDYFYPSLLLLNSDPAEIQNACNYIYYKPISKE